MSPAKSEDGLFPPPYEYELGWTTSPGVDHPSIHRLTLSDKSLGVHRVMANLSHNVVPSPLTDSRDDQDLSWEAVYPKGSINPTGNIRGGFGFYVRGPAEFEERLRAAKEAIFSYSVLFQDGWEWVKGGKLPGAFGGIYNSAYGCTGGRQDARCKCFDLRLMWRPKGAGEVYPYLPITDGNDDRLSNVPPFSHKNPDYGYSVGRGAFHFTPGQWHTIAERVRLNDIGQANGELEIWFDGKSSICVNGLTFREDASSRMQGMHFQTFFGGHGEDWASPKHQRAWFSDISCAIIASS